MGKMALIVGLAALAFGALYYVMAVQSNSPVLYLLLPIIAAGMYAISLAATPLAAALGVLTPAMSAFAVPFAIVALMGSLLAGALGLMAFGFAAMFEAIDLEKIVAFIAFGAALVLGAPFMIMAALGLGALAIGMFLLGVALLTVSTDDLQALGQAMEGMGRAMNAQTTANHKKYSKRLLHKCNQRTTN